MLTNRIEIQPTSATNIWYPMVGDTGTNNGSKGPRNLFTLTAGIRPSYGYFRMLAKDVVHLLGNTPLTLQFYDQSSNLPAIRIHKLYLLKTTPVRQLGRVVDIVLVDERFLWQHCYGSQDYNTYPAGRQLNTAEDDYVIENVTTSGDEFTYEQIFSDINEILTTAGLSGITYTDMNASGLWGSASRKPRHVIAAHVSLPIILQELLIQTHSFLAPQISTVGNGLSEITEFKLYRLGDMDLTESQAYLALRKNSQWSQFATLNRAITHGKTVQTLFPSEQAETLNQRHELFHTGETHPDAGFGFFKLESKHEVAWKDGSIVNDSKLTTIGNEIATEHVVSYNSLLFDDTYAGVLPIIINSVYQQITWVSDIDGARTETKSFRVVEEPLQAPVISTLHQYSGGYMLPEIPPQTVFRNAKVITNWLEGATVEATLLDVTGEIVTVNFYKTYSVDLFPKIVVDEVIPILKNWDDKWYCPYAFNLAKSLDEVLSDYGYDTTTHELQRDYFKQVKVFAFDDETISNEKVYDAQELVTVFNVSTASNKLRQQKTTVIYALENGTLGSIEDISGTVCP